MKIAYQIRHSLYLNITNRCTLACVFCPKFRDWSVQGHFLKLDHEPTVAEILASIGDPRDHDEIVFCGYGEPTLRLEVLKKVAAEMKKSGARVRLNTDGLGSLVHGRNIVPELTSLIDAVSVSLNAPDARTYKKICRSHLGASAYPAVKAFIVAAKPHISAVTATVVGLPRLDVEACRRIITRELRVNFRLRPHNQVG